MISYKDVFPHIKANKIWLGNHSGHTLFEVPTSSSIPESYDKEDTKRLKSNGYIIDKNGKLWRNLGNICWFTNIDHGRRHQPLQLLTMAENIKYSKHPNVRGQQYVKYDNYDALEVPYYDAIPSDYDDVMGVPLSFLEKHCPEQYEIVTLGIGEDFLKPTKFYKYFADPVTGIPNKEKRDYHLWVRREDGKYLTDLGYRVSGVFSRIMIKKKI